MRARPAWRLARDSCAIASTLPVGTGGSHIRDSPLQPAAERIIPGCGCNPCHLLCTLSNQSDKAFNDLDLFVLLYLWRSLLSAARLHLVPFSHFRGFLRGAAALIWYLDVIRSSRRAADTHGRDETAEASRSAGACAQTAAYIKLFSLCSSSP